MFYVHFMLTNFIYSILLYIMVAHLFSIICQAVFLITFLFIVFKISVTIQFT